MNFINPIEILELNNAEISSIDNTIIKKNKKRVLAEIELSDDGCLNYKGQNISKSDCEKAFNELDNSDKIEFYHFIANNKNLNNFLGSGDLLFFNSFRQESIYKLTDFVEFISPYFADRYDRAILKAFQNDDILLFKKITSITPIVTASHLDKTYKSVSIAIKANIIEVDNATRDIKKEESIYDENDISDVYDWATDLIDTEKINALPQYFQSIRNQCAKSIRNLSVNVFNTFNDADVSMDLITYSLNFKIDGLTKQQISDDYNQIKEIRDKRNEQESYEPLLRKYALFLIEVKSKLENIKNKTLTTSGLTAWINDKLIISEVNKLDSTFDEIRNQIALGLRALSVEVWNTYNAIDNSISLINKAESIDNLNYTTRQNLVEAKNQLNELKRKIDLSKKAAIQNEIINTPRSASNNIKSKSSGDNSVYLGLFILVVVIIIIALLSNSGSNNSSTNYNTNNSNSNLINTTPTEPIDIAKKYTIPLEVESKYKGNKLKNGKSPLDACFGKGVYSGNAKLTIKNGSASDAIICLYSINKDKTIRNEYVQANSNFTMSNIAQGAYKIRVFYGNDWNPEKINSCGKKGNFESDVSFSEFDGSEYFEDSERGFTEATITLYTVVGGNASSTAIDESKFFSK